MGRKFISSKLCSQYEIVNDILESALEAVDPYLCTRKFIKMNQSRLEIGQKVLPLNEIENIYVIGTGKAVLPMTKAVDDALGSLIKGGVIIGKHADRQIMDQLPASIEILFGDHPIPTEKSLESAKTLADFSARMTKNDLVICLISGGGSSLMTLPVEPISLKDMQAVTRQLLFSGATINEVNAVRKHLDKIKGGGLARMVWPAKLATLILSDVIGDSLDAIASGPTVADPSTFSDVLQIIQRYQIEKKIPENAMRIIKNGADGLVPETVKEGDKCLLDAHTFIIGSLQLAINAAGQRANQAGIHTHVFSSDITGEARKIGEQLASKFLQLIEEKRSANKPMLLIAGGETTVTVKGNGKGGRNQETALSAALQIKGRQNCLFISLATDGEDGPTDAAGAAVNGWTIAEGSALGMKAEDYLAMNDAYNYLDRVGSLIKIGSTGTNVNDLVFVFNF